MKIIACGGRDFTDMDFVFSVLDKIHASSSISMVIEGGANGADFMSGVWAKTRGIETKKIQAEWAKFGKKSSPLRNIAMLKENPQMVIAFAGGPGTAHMIKISKEKGVIVYEPKQ